MRAYRLEDSTISMRWGDAVRELTGGVDLVVETVGPETIAESHHLERTLMTKALYTARAHVTGGRAAGHGRTDDGMLDVQLRHPKELGGDGAGTNPEQLFAVGYAACLATVLNLLGKRDNLAVDPAIDSAVHLIPAGGGRFKLGVELEISLPSHPNAADLVREAHQICPYSNATRGNIEVTLIVNGLRL